MLSILSSLAQDESRSISENVTWSVRKRVQEGKVSLAYSTFLRYDKGEDGKLKVNESQAETIKLIFKLFMIGYSAYHIKEKSEELKNKNTVWKNKVACDNDTKHFM